MASTAQTEQSFLAHSSSGKINVFEDVVEGDVSVMTKSPSQCGRRQSRKRRKRKFRSSKAGEHKVEPHHIWLQFADGVQQTHRSFEAVEPPAADHVEPWQLGLLLSVQRFSVLIGREFIVGQFVGENRQTDVGMALQFPRDVKRVLVQLARARGKVATKQIFIGSRSQNRVMRR